MNFEETNKVEHKVKDEWHYETMISNGYIPETLYQIGLVRSYKYSHPTKAYILCCTGVNSDYFKNIDTGEVKLWCELEDYLKNLE